MLLKCTLTNVLMNCFAILICLQVLADFLKMMNDTESIRNLKQFASTQTMESFRVTLMSVLSLFEFLHSRGVSYVLTASLNQDPLEVI